MSGRPLTPTETKNYLLTQHNLRRSERTLQQYRRDGGGPPYVRTGNDLRYFTDSLDAWVAELYGDEVTNTSQERARRLMSPAKKDRAHAHAQTQQPKTQT